MSTRTVAVSTAVVALLWLAIITIIFGFTQAWTITTGVLV